MVSEGIKVAVFCMRGFLLECKKKAYLIFVVKMKFSYLGVLSSYLG